MSQPPPEAVNADAVATDMLRRRIAELEARLAEAEETLDAIRSGEVDAVVVGDADQRRVFTLESADRPYRLLVEEMREGAVTLSADGLVLYCNHAFADMVGVPASQVVGARFSRFVFESRDPLGPMFGAGGGRTEIVLRAAAGKQHPASLSLSPLPTDEGQLLCGVIADLTESRAHARDLADARQDLAVAVARQESENRYRSLFDAIDAGFCIIGLAFDADGRATDYQIVEANPAFERQTGLVGAQGKWVSEAAPELERHWFETYGRVALTGEPVRFENHAASLGDRWYEVYAYRVDRPEENRVAVLFNDISDRKRAEAALRESETRYRALFEAIDEGFCVIEFLDGPHGPLSDYVHVEANPAYLGNAGIADIVGKRLREIVSEKEADGWAAIYREVLVSGEPVRFERELVETGRHLELAAFRVEPAERRQVAVLFQDITTRKRVEAALTESEARFRNIADHAPLMMWVTDPTGYCTYLNRAWYEFTGQSEGEAEGFGWLDATHPDDKQRTEDEFVAANAEKRPFRVEYRLRRKDGAYRWAIDAAAPRFGPDGVYLGYVGSVIDIDDRREIEDRLRLATDASQIGIWDFDPVSGSLRWDERCKAMFGLGAEAHIDYDVFLAGLHPEDRARADAAVAAALNPDDPESLHIQYRTIGLEDGVERWIAATGQAIFEGEHAARRAVRFVGTIYDITDRVEAENRLRESEARFRAMADSAPAPVWVTGPGGIEFANKAFGEIAGLPPEQITGEIWATLVHAEDLPEALRQREAAWAERRAYSFTARFRSADGSLLWMQVSCQPRFDGDALIGFVGIAFDITGLRTTEIALRESEERLRIALSAGQLGDWQWDLDSDVITFSEQAATLFELPPGPVGTWQELQKLIDAGDSTAAMATVEAAVANRHDYNIEFRLRRPGGTYAWINALGRPVYDDDGRPTGVIGVVQDITARKQAEAVLQDLNETLEQRVAERTKERDRLWTLSEDMLARADYTGMMSAVNPAWGKVLGWTEHKLLTTGYAEFMHPDDAGKTLAAIEAMGQTGQPTRFQNRILTAGGDWTPIDWTVAPEPDGVNFIAVGRDLTEDKAREKELELAQEALRQAQKMETLGQLTGGVAHDFNNLLQIVSGNIGLIQRNLADGDAKLRRAADNAARGAERAAVLTQRLLAFSRRQPLAPKAIDPNKLVGGMSDLLHRTLGETIEIETVLSPRLWPVEADPHQLENAILNLAINARDAMPDGGKLTIETCNTHLDRAYVAQNAEVASGQYVCISVTDGGSGMDPDTLARAFEPFFTTKDVGKGTGLGLSMVYGFVKQSGGHLKIYSERGEGTTVKIYLPRLIGAQPDADGEDEELAPEGGQDETILVCEDDADVRAYTVDVLRELGYRVLEAEDGPATLALLDRSGPIDLLFTDVVLPGGMTGAELAREAQARRPGLKVLFTTGYARNAIVHHGRLDAGVELITKPFSYADLAARVRDILDGQK